MQRVESQKHMYVCLSGGKNCLIFGKFCVFCVLVTSVLRFVLLLHHRWNRVEIGLKWVKHFSAYCFVPSLQELGNFLLHFTPLISFHTLWKYQKTKVSKSFKIWIIAKKTLADFFFFIIIPPSELQDKMQNIGDP